MARGPASLGQAAGPASLAARLQARLQAQLVSGPASIVLIWPSNHAALLPPSALICQMSAQPITRLDDLLPARLPDCLLPAPN